MRQIVTHVSEALSFDELNPAAKERARNWLRECMDESDFSCEIEEFTNIGELMGIEFASHNVNLHGGGMRQEPNIYWSVGYCQSDYAAFEGVYDYKADAVAKLREINNDDTWEPIRIATELARIQLTNAFGIRADIKYTDYYGFSITVSDRRNEDRSDELIEAADREITELVKDFARYLYQQLRDQSDYLHSDEHIDECMIANEYMFDEEGNRHAYA